MGGNATLPIGILAPGDWFTHRELQLEGYVQTQMRQATVVFVRRIQHHPQPDMPSPAFKHWTVPQRWPVERTEAKEVPRTPSRPAARLSSDDAQDIRESDETLLVLAERYGVADSTISRIRNRQTWRP